MGKTKKRKIVFYKKKRILIYGMLGLFLFLGMGYSLLNTELNILGDITVKEYVEPTLYNVFQREYKKGGSVLEYTGNHEDSMDSTLSTEKIYYWYADSNNEASSIARRNNVLFADHCWKMVRTTDTGGVKLIYNGEAENNQCVYNSSKRQVGYAGTRSSMSLNSNYWYGTDYTYDSTNQTFKISGTTEQTTWNATTGPDLIGKYTCKNTTEDSSCATLYLVESYYSSTSGYVLPLNGNSYTDQYGILPFNGSSGSPIYAGYMYGDYYSQGSISQSQTRFYGSLLMFGTSTTLSNIGSGIWYADDISYNSSTRKYTLVNPSKISTVEEFPTLVGKYTLFSGSSTDSTTYGYFVGSYEGNNRFQSFSLSSGMMYADYNPIYFADSYTDNGDGTYTLDNPTSIDRLDWASNYTNYVNKYTCGDNKTTCSVISYTISTNSSSANTIYDAAKKFLIAKSRNGLNLTDTLLVTPVDWYYNYQDYNAYRYTCGNDSAVCTENNLSWIASPYDTYYRYNSNRYFGNSVTWDGTKYTLVDVSGIETNTNFNDLSTHHYTCDGAAQSCTTVKYIFNSLWTYITLQGGEDIDQAWANMMQKNTNNSIIKSGVDAWYKKYLLNYDSYIEDTIFCNDRSVTEKGGWDPNGGKTSVLLQFKESTTSSDLDCTNLTDKFSVSNSQAPLTYKVGLLSNPETKIINNHWIISYSSAEREYWLSSPVGFKDNINSLYHTSIYSDWNSRQEKSNISKGVRPVISLKPGAEYSSGDGSFSNPYVVKMNS